MPGRKRNTRKGRDANKDWRKMDEGSPLPKEIEEEKSINQKNSKKKATKQKQKSKTMDVVTPCP